MSRFDWLTVLLSVLSLLVLPSLGLLVRLTIRWTRTEDRLNVLIGELREDRATTDRRLRWLEENVWNYRGRRP